MKHPITFEIQDGYFEELKNKCRGSGLTENSQAENFFTLGLAAAKFLPADEVDKLWEQVLQTFHPKSAEERSESGIFDSLSMHTESEEAKRVFQASIAKNTANPKNSIG